MQVTARVVASRRFVREELSLGVCYLQDELSCVLTVE
jgi:hypothetical protein